MGKRKPSFDRGHWQIQRERHHLLDRRPPREFEVHSVQDVLPKVVKKLGLEARVWEQSLASEWESLVGEQIAKHARPGRYQYGTLYVYVDHPTWLSELSRFGQKEMLAKLQERFGKDKIKKLRLQIDPDAQT